MQDLPNHGMMYDHPEHLSLPDDWSQLCNFEDPENMKLGYPVRNLSALQLLETVRNGVLEEIP
ncbi:MAG: hypothetical protein MUO76_01185 [Anaerolineaceae bacterium]|nr:hypothetical protein [Anaerolineaceae bacterium]